MNINKQRHKLLEILSVPYLHEMENTKKTKDTYSLCMSFDFILEKLGCEKTRLNFISAELFVSDEVASWIVFDEIKGMHLKSTGLDSFSNKKRILCHPNQAF